MAKRARTKKLSPLTDLDNCNHLLTPDEALPFTRMGRNLFYRMLNEGKIPAHRCGRKFLIPREALQGWLQSA